MSASSFTESVVEEAALAWLEGIGYAIKHGPAIAPSELGAERAEYAQVVLEDRLRQALAQLNPALPPEALDDAFRKLRRREGPTTDAAAVARAAGWWMASQSSANSPARATGCWPRLISGELRVPGVKHVVARYT